MKRIVSIAILVLVVTATFGTVLTTMVLADENYNDWSQENGEENNPWGDPIYDEDGNIIGYNEYPTDSAADARAEDRTRNKDN
jgi:hypothetical protein